MADRNEVLANFQALSNIEDIGVCLDILEQKGWDLTAAVNSVMPDNNYPSTSANHPPLQSRGGFVDLTSSSNGSTSHSHVVDLTRDPLHTLHTNVPVASVSSRECTLTVFYGVRVISMQLPNTFTITELKQKLEVETGLPPRHQFLMFSGLHSTPSNQTQLREISTPTHMLTVVLERRVSSVPPPPLTAHLPPSTAVRGDDDDGSLEALEATLTSSRIQPQQAPDPAITVDSSPSSSTYGDAYDQIDNTEEEEEGEGEGDMDEDGGLDSLIFEAEDTADDVYQRAMKEPLIPESCVDPSEALQHFTSRFELRYGATHPLFYVGGLKDAVREATSGVGTHKPMMIYLHHDASILSNVFCSQLLCSESVVSYLTNNYITWAWDLTKPQHRKQLLDMIAECFGPVARARVNDIHSDRLPVILIVSKVQGAVDVRNIIQGEANLDSLMTSLITAVEEHSLQVEEEKREERERVARENMIAEQNAAYQESLQADREKMKRKEEQKLQEEEDRQEKEAIRQSMASVVPEEPVADCPEKISTLKIRLPDGSAAQRRFLATNTIQDLLNFIGSMNYPVHDYKVLRSYPRTDLSSLEPDIALEAAGLCPQDTLFLEER